MVGMACTFTAAAAAASVAADPGAAKHETVRLLCAAQRANHSEAHECCWLMHAVWLHLRVFCAAALSCGGVLKQLHGLLDARLHR